jgi:exosortase B
MPTSLLAWAPVFAGLLLIYVPSFIDLFNGIWKTDRNAHGPIVLVVSLWFLGFRIRQLLAENRISYQPAPLAGFCLLAFGLGCFALGRSQGVLLFEVGSLIPILAACVVVFFGAASLTRLWFAFFFMLFFIPLPASIVDALTQPLKIGVSFATEHLLYWLGYPIAREGVILHVGQYRLLVADACAGLHSLFTLEALGLLYMNLVGHQSGRRNALLAALILPISFTANVVRVITLSLITYYLGDAAGQGFLHGFAGMLLFLSALMMIIGVDTLLGRLLDPRDGGGAPKAPSPPAPHTGAYTALGIRFKPAIAVGVAMMLAVALAQTIRPAQTLDTAIPELAGMVPASFGDWREEPSPYLQVDLANGEDPAFDKLYEATLMRTYVNGAGQRVMLALAYARRQSQDVRIHRPEVCYEAQGFEVIAMQPADFRLGRGADTITGVRLLTRNRDRFEAVSYWIRVGDQFPRGAFETRWNTFRQGLAGRIPDGLLVRVSTIDRSASGTEAAYKLQERFLLDLVNALPPVAAHLLVAESSG